MDKQSAIKLIRETFENSFGKEQFVYFIKNLFNRISLDTFEYYGQYIPDSFKPSISKYERIGKYQDSDDNRIDVLIVNLNKETSIERARTMQRNFIAGYLNGKYGSTAEKNAALVAFISPNEEDWRFSLVKMEYKLTQTKTGRPKGEGEFTPAKRLSFLVGRNEPNHTAQSRLYPLLKDDINNPTLIQLEDACNIETVTKEFFEKYRELFLSLKESLDELVKKDSKIRQDFKTKGVDTVDFAKKLLGQIVFLYFLQKKGWFGVARDADWGTGPKNFLRQLFEKKIANYDNFFNDILEPLFYEALAVERSDNFYSRFNCKIPFLNGGLFDPINNYDWVHTDIIMPDELFSNNIKTKEGDIRTGILDVFDRYNFTVKEDEPLEKEVAIDPEMLGKVFENLLEVKDRKSKGTYYTPREIVHYMCQESLTNYLATELDGKVNKKDIETLIKFGETAVEHDSRVINEGRETPTYSFKLPENIRKHAKLIDEKLTSIRVCDPAVGSGAFPVGMMNKVIRTRNALTSYIKGKNGRTEYDFKRHAIQNCLYGVDINLSAVEIAKLRLWLSLIVDEEDIKRIKPLPNLDYKIVQGNSLLSVEKNLFNLDLFNKLEELKPLFFNETNARKKQEYKNQIDKLISQITNGRKDFDFEVYFSEVFHEKKGFDVVIANPPYGANIDATIKIYAKLYPNTTKAYKDIYKIFIELGLSKVLTTNGILCYIIPNTLLLQPRYKDARQFLLRYKIIEILNLGEKVFEQVVVPTCVVFVQKNSVKNNALKFGDLSDKSKFCGDLNVIDYKPINQEGFEKISDNIFVSEKRELKSNEVYLDEIMDFKDAGINYQRVNVGLSAKGASDLSKRLLYDGKKENREDVEYWKGSDINAYFIAPKTLRFVRIKTTGKLKPNERVILNKTYFELTPKIIWRQTAEYPIASIDDRGIWFGRSIQAGRIKQEYSTETDYRYLLSLFNSKYLRYLYIQNVKESGRVFPQVKLEKLKKLPIKKVSLNEQKPFINIVDKIFTITKNNDYLQNLPKQAKVKEYERQIDQMVYKLYELTKEEIKIVEGINYPAARPQGI